MFVTKRTGRFYYSSQLLSALPYEMIINTHFHFHLSFSTYPLSDHVFDVRLGHKTLAREMWVAVMHTTSQEKLSHFMVQS